MREMKVFSGRANPELARRICDYLDIPLGRISIDNFPDGEIRCKIDEDVRGRDVFLNGEHALRGCAKVRAPLWKRPRAKRAEPSRRFLLEDKLSGRRAVGLEETSASEYSNSEMFLMRRGSPRCSLTARQSTKADLRPLPISAINFPP